MNNSPMAHSMNLLLAREETAAQDRLSARWAEARRVQMETIMAKFTQAGYVPVSPPVLQDSRRFFDVAGEAIREKTFACSDAFGTALCLRSDLTIPACFLYLDRHRPGDPVKYAYSGPVFRREAADSPLAACEIHQLGIESFADPRTLRADVEAVALIAAALRGAGLRAFALKLGDVGIFAALAGFLGLPERWTKRIWHLFRQERHGQERLPAYLSWLCRRDKPLPAFLDASLHRALDPADPEGSELRVQEYLAAQGITWTGRRTAAEVTERLLDRIRDVSEPPLSPAAAGLVCRYLEISAKPDAACAEMHHMFRKLSAEPAQSAAENFAARLNLLRKEGVDVADSTFAAGFGRTFEYYTGFVFEIVSPSAPGAPIAAGGRYDRLLRAAGAPHDIPAAGGAIYMDRLLSVVRGE